MQTINFLRATPILEVSKTIKKVQIPAKNVELHLYSSLGYLHTVFWSAEANFKAKTGNKGSIKQENNKKSFESFMMPSSLKMTKNQAKKKYTTCKRWQQNRPQNNYVSPDIKIKKIIPRI